MRCQLSSLLLFATVAVAQAREVVRLDLQHTFTAPEITSAAAFSANGALLATCSIDGDVAVWEVATRQVTWRQWADRWLGNARLAFAPDGRRLALAGSTLLVLDVATGRELLRREDCYRTVCWSPDGAVLAYGQEAHVARLDMVTLTDLPATVDLKTGIDSLRFTPDGKWIHALQGDRVWQTEARDGRQWAECFTYRTEPDVRQSDALVDAMRVGEEWLTIAGDGRIQRGEQVWQMPDCVWNAAVTGDGRAFAVDVFRAVVAKWDRYPASSGVVHWRAADGRERDLPLESIVTALALSPDGATLFVATANGDNVLHAFAGSAAPVAGHVSGARRAALSPDGRWLAMELAWGGNRVVVQSLREPGHRNIEGALTVDRGAEGAQFVVRTEDRVLEIDGRSGAVLKQVPYEARTPPWAGPIFSVAGATVVPVAQDGLLLDLAPGAKSPVANWFAGDVIDVAHAEDGTAVLAREVSMFDRLDESDPAAEREESFLIWHGPTVQPRLCVAGRVRSIDFAAGGKRLAYVSGPASGDRVRNGTLHVLAGSPMRETKSGPADLTWLRCLDDHLAIAHDGERITIWDLDSLAVVQTIAPGFPIRSACLSVDRRTLVLATARDVRVFAVARL